MNVSLFARRIGLTALLWTSLAAEGWSQTATGTITGVVSDVESLGPVSAAQVHLPQLRIGALTQANGRYLLVNVPAGRHRLMAERIGYGTETREITVTAGQATEVNFAMAQDALALDEIVVTGTAGQARRREVGNTIAQVNVAQVIEPVTNIGSMLQGRLAGVRIVEGGGYSGSGADIRLRGNVSMSMSNQPLVYIDGVRAKSEPYPGAFGQGGRGSGGSMQLSNPLSDINPADIERIELVKGPAATTLYGTEAAAGVIQIFTKSGAGGATVWSMDLNEGFSYMRPHYNEEAPRLFADPILRHGLKQGYGLQVRGGTADRLGYFVSGKWENNQGAWFTDYQKGLALRANMQFRPHEDLLIQFNQGYTRTDLSNPAGGGTGSTLYFALARGDQAAYGFGSGTRSPDVLRRYLDQRNFTTTNRYVNGFTATWTPLANFVHRLTLGHDYAGFGVERIFPYCWRCGLQGSTARDLGSIHETKSENRLLSLDYVGSLTIDLLENLRSTFSFGVQGVENNEETVWASGLDFPGPGDYTVSSTARREGWSSKLRMITGGFFVQDMLGFADRYFLTLGVRVDGNSAFGSGLGLQPYPKASLSYVLSDESFWPESLGQMKLRAAYGWAGRAPGAFDAVRTWDPVGWGTDQSAFKPQNLGNPDLGPERTREIELGFDGSAMRDRLTVAFTYYSQSTVDALFTVPSSVTDGGWAAQLENVGEINNSGAELTVNATVLALPSLRWEIGTGVMLNKSEVVSLGGSPPFSVGGGGWVIEGQPAPVVRAHWIENYDEAAEPIITPDKLLGPAYPTRIVNLQSTITLPGGIQLSGRGELQGGHYIANGDENGVMGRFIPSTPCFAAYRKVEPGWELGPPYQERGIPLPARGQPFPSSVLAWERANCFGQLHGTLSTQPSDYFELRDVSVAVPLSSLLPSSVTGWADQLHLTASLKNAWGWKNRRLRFGHPESGVESGGARTYALVKDISRGLPIQSGLLVSLRAVF
jgi:outer membrane receptor protein involved in Fe transport